MPFKYRETEDCDTPAALATSILVGSREAFAAREPEAEAIGLAPDILAGGQCVVTIDTRFAALRKVVRLLC